MLTLKQKAIRFRNVINQAKKRGALDWHSTFSKFPDDCCDMTCDLLGQYLLESGIETYQINGVNKYDSSWHHVWLDSVLQTRHLIIHQDRFTGTETTVTGNITFLKAIPHRKKCQIPSSVI